MIFLSMLFNYLEAYETSKKSFDNSISKEIVYHGDVLNTASRLEAECNRYNQTLLVSEFIFK
jgi:hypothetical protein